MATKWLRLVAGFACVALATAACTSSNSTGGSAKSGSSVTASTTANLKGAPVVIGSMYPIDAALTNFPQLQYMAEIAVDVVNAHGGIKGHPLKWVHCDDRGDPNVAATCANTLTNQDKVRAMVESVGLEGNIAWPYIQKADIINWFNVPIWPEDGTSPLSYPAGLGIYEDQNVGLLVKPGEFKKVACLSTAGAFAGPICDFVKSSLAARGITNFTEITWPVGTTAFAPYAEKVVADGADAVVVVEADAITAPVLQALAAANAKVTVLEPSTSVGGQSIAVAKENSIPLRVAASWAADASMYPARQQMLANIAKYSSAVGAPANFDTSSDNAYNMYFGILSLANVMNHAKSLSTADLQAYIAAHPVVTGVAPPLDWNKPGPIPGNPRVVQVYGTSETLNSSGDLVSTSPTWSSGFPGVSDVTCCSS
jgi:ABC-type branched-subunit amino acid transport system substrate-binding protein